MSLTPGTRVQHYEIVATLGAGGMGDVYVAEDLQLRRRVALKVLPARADEDPDRRRRFELEARAASALDHPNIVTIYEWGLAAEGHFIAMELVEGRTLREWAGPPVAIDGVTRVGWQVARALVAAHAAGITHRDIKPENILVRDDGQVKLLDFGLARLTSSIADDIAADTMAATLPGTLLGTVQYMSPEQGRSDVATTATDIFSLGLVLYEMATGRHPFAAPGPMQVLQGILSDQPLPPARLNPEVPESLNALILEMLRKDPRARPGAADVEQALAALTDREPGPSGAPIPRWRPVTVGRDPELSDLRAAFDAVALGRGQIVSIGGEPGAGKTTLVDQFLSDLISARVPCRIARGRCSERLAGSEAYGAWLEALEGLVHDGTGAVARAMKTLAPTWYQRIVPLPDSTSTPLHAEPAAASQERLNRELASLLQELSRSEPVVFFIDDMQWADTSTTDLVRFLADRFDGLRVLLLATYRPSDLLLAKHPFAFLKTSLQARSACHDIELGLLTSADVERYLAIAFPGHDFPVDLGARIHARTEGNPLFVSELLRHLRDTDAIVRGGHAWIVSRPLDEIDRDLPESVRGMIERKLLQLGDEDRRLLAAASVQGYEFDSTIVAVALSQDPAEIEERLDQLDRVHAVVRLLAEREFPDRTLTTRYRFSHVLYQNALCESLRPTRRAHIAGGLGRALEKYRGLDQPDLASELAVLFETARTFARAADYFRLAAQNAARLFAAREAVTLARRSLEMLETLPVDRDRRERELAALIVLGNALIATGGYAAPHVEETYARAAALCEELGDTPHRLPATWGFYQYKLMRANYGDVLERRQELLQLFERKGGPEMMIADRLVGQAFFFTGDLARGRRHFDHIVSTYVPAHHRPLTWLYAQEPGMAGHALLGLTLWLLGHPDRGLAHSDESLRLGQEVPQHNSQANALFWAGTQHQFRGEPQRVGELAKQLTILASEQGLKFWLAVGACQLGTALVARGAIEDGLDKMRRGMAGSRGAGAEVLQSFNFCLLAAAYGQAARPRDGLAALDEAEELVTAHNERFWEGEMHRLRGELLLMDGRNPLEVQSHFERAITVARRQGAKSLELRASTSLARLWQREGHHAEARDLLTAIYGWFVEGFDTPDLKDARALLGEP